jgi:hypothetical protein
VSDLPYARDQAEIYLFALVKSTFIKVFELDTFIIVHKLVNSTFILFGLQLLLCA